MNPAHDTAPFPHLLIRASAGTGKTYQLSNRFLGLLRDQVRCDHILATTFTRKAAGEILDRVILRLAQAVVDDDKREELRAGTGPGPWGSADALRLLQEVLGRVHRLRVGTLDSFFAQIARSFSLELGMPPGWQIIDDLLDARLRREAVHTVLRSSDATELRTLIQLLTKGEAVRGISQLIHETISGLYHLFLDTSEPAWQAIPRGRRREPGELAAALRDLRELELPAQRMRTARDADCQRLEQGDWEKFLGTGLAKKVVDGESVFAAQPIPEPALALYRQLIDHVAAQMIGRVARQTEASYRLLAQFHRVYERLKHAQRALRFEDVTRQLARLRQTVPEDRMAFRLDSRIDHLLLDEFQDTSPDQWRVVRPLAERVTAADGNTSFFCVGDVKQAIYGWRGGVAEIFDAIDDQLPGLQAQSLNASYRSAEPVIETVNRVFAGIPSHPNLRQAEAAVRQWTRRFETHQTRRPDLSGFAQLRTAPLARDDQLQRDVTLAFAAQHVARLVRQSPGFRIGVLVRKNQTVGQLIYHLRTQQILASEEGGNPLTDAAAVLLVLSALQLADHPGDSVAAFHLAHSPLAPLWQLEFPLPRANPAGGESGTRKRELQPSDLADATSPTLRARAAQAIREQLVQEGYGPTLRDWAHRLAPHCNRRELSRLEQLVEMAYSYEPHATLRATDFAAYVRTTRIADPIPADVRVMTIHQAKGLEFDIVVLPELDADLIGQPDAFVVERPDVVGPVQAVCRYANQQVQSLMPPRLQRMFQAATEREVSESLCVLYVALTRPKHALDMILSPSKPNERTFPRTLAGLLRIALANDQPAPPDTVLYQHGDPDWHRRHERPVAERAPERDGAAAELAPVQVRLAPLTGPPRRGWLRTSPSGLEGGATVNVHQLLYADTKTAAFLYGQLIHAWFEQITWLEDGVPSDRELREVGQWTAAAAGAATTELAEPLAHFRRLLDQPAIARLLSRQRYEQPGDLDFPEPAARQWGAGPLSPSVQNERPFACRDGDRLLNGFIDRLVLLRQNDRLVAAEILDYKTDALGAADAETLDDKRAFYSPQLQAYRQAVVHLTRLPPTHVAARLVFLQAGRIETVPWLEFP